MSEIITWSFGELEGVLASIHGIDATKRTAFQSRLKNFHRHNYPMGFRATKGKAAAYSPLQIIDMALAIEMTQLGLPPERAIWVLVYNRWPTLMAVQMAARELAKNPRGFDLESGLADDLLSMFIYFDPAALHALTLDMPSKDMPDMDEAANSFFYGGSGVVQENVARWTSGMVPRISLINVTAMIGFVVTSPYKAGSANDVSYRQRFFQQLDTEAFSKEADWQGGDEAEAGYVLGLLEREEITDPIKLGERVGISPERAARYIQEEADRKVRRTDDSNS